MSNLICPDKRPEQSVETTKRLLRQHGIMSPVALLGVRGYYLRSMGDPKKNDISTYDDAIFLVSPKIYKSYNANCDPSIERDRVASLCPGVWTFEISIHGKSRPEYQQYPCLEQFGRVRVKRYNSVEEEGMFAIQIHKGGYGGTSSLGCQTIFPNQYDDFIDSIKKEMKDHDQNIVQYLLMEYQGGNPPI